ncbi:hypothetical protein ACET8O_20165 [Aeromonas veronii]
MIPLCQGCAHLIKNGEQFDCAKRRCIKPVERKKRTPKAKAPTQPPRTSSLLLMTVHHAGWAKRKGDRVRIDDPGSSFHGNEFIQKSNEVVVLNKVMFIYLKGLPGELAPIRICK